MSVDDSHETPNMYPNLRAIPLSDQQQFRINKIKEISIIVLLKWKRERDNYWAKDLTNIFLLLTILTIH